jgi:hypothetical protein
MTNGRPLATVVVPAHNEAFGIRRLLSALHDGAGPGELHIVVVCNGCTDDTASVARAFGHGVDVVELEMASKANALVVGGSQVSTFPVLFIDADVSIDVRSVRALVATLETGILAAAPQRTLVRTGSSVLANWYYDVWERLPNVSAGLFGRGVIALSEDGFRRVSALPQFTADDAAMSDSFRPAERQVVDGARVDVWPARTWRALVRRRIRAVNGVRELRESGYAAADSATRLADIRHLVRTSPAIAGKVLVFAATTVVARERARVRRRRNITAWERDDSSRPNQAQLGDAERARGRNVTAAGDQEAPTSRGG